MKLTDKGRLAVLLERHADAVPATSVALAMNIMSMANIYELGGFAVELDDLITRHRQSFPWLFRNHKEEL